jgi:hypothetical protein
MPKGKLNGESRSREGTDNSELEAILVQKDIEINLLKKSLIESTENVRSLCYTNKASGVH